MHLVKNKLCIIHIRSMNTLLGVSFLYCINVSHLTCLGYFCLRVLAMSFFLIKKMQDTIRTQKIREIEYLIIK